MKTFLITTVSAFLLTTSVFASDLTGAYGNTVEVTDSSGVVSKFFINADNTYSGDIAGQIQYSGTWVIENGAVCFNTTDQSGNAVQSCHLMLLGKQVGDSWTETEDGETFSATIVAGR